MDKKASSSSAAVLLVCLYALFNAFIFGISAMVTLIENQTESSDPCPCVAAAVSNMPTQYAHGSCVESTWFSLCALTDAAAAEASALVRWQLWCSAPQAAAAALALLLTGRRRRWSRWALALAALGATAANHYMDARGDRIFLAAGAAPGHARIVVNVVMHFVVAVLDLGFLCLLLLGVGGEEE